MALWESLLPVAVERARLTYAHTAECEYTRLRGPGGTLCSCGEGRDLPPTFEDSLNQVDSSGRLMHPVFYRAALSPLFVPAEKFSAKPLKTGPAAVRCKQCGKGGNALMTCARCRKVAYCSKDCQRLNWKTHKCICSA